ncbi:hypothetical protein HMSSN139_26250 [Paenibacillus sp. HMSSN-139]|nr:hypothetical protein HMSSN139_26250 [Paenibacillus sp. HMSSN-139]
MGFSQELRRQADGIYQAIFDHPFVKGIASGQLGREQLIHYVKQDYEYLNAYMRITGSRFPKAGPARRWRCSMNRSTSF